MMFAHGFGCDQNMWRFVEPAFEDRFRTVLFDHVGAGASDLKAYDKAKYSSLLGMPTMLSRSAENWVCGMRYSSVIRSAA